MARSPSAAREAISTALGLVPHPAARAAAVALDAVPYVTGEKGLRELAEALLFSRLGRLGRVKMDIFTRSDMDEKLKRELQKDIAGPKAEEVFRQTGKFVDPVGNVYKEIPNPPIEELISRLPPNPHRGWIKRGSLEDLLPLDALYKEVPAVRHTDVDIRVDYGFPDQGLYRPGTIRVLARSPEEAGRLALHEVQHAVQEHQKLPGGASPSRLSELYAAAGKRADPWDAAFDAYRHFTGEALARAASQPTSEILPWKRDPHFPTLNLNRLISGNANTGPEYYKLLKQHGWYTSDEEAILEALLRRISP